MSGFCGWIGITPSVEPVVVINRMADSLPFAVPGENRNTCDSDTGLASGAGTRAGGLVSEAGFIAAFEGYPRWSDPGLTAISKSQGVGRALIEGYRIYGADLPARTEGPVSFAVLEPGSQSGVVAIDRAGIHGICFYKAPEGGLIFGSSADAVRSFPGVGSTLSAQALYEFLFFIDRIPAPYTIYEEQSKLVPGECIVISRGTCSLQRYWRATFDPDYKSSKSSLRERLREELDRAVRHCLEGEDVQKVGSFLSGGLDSSTVSGLFANNVQHRAKAFTISFADERFDESPFASIAASRFGLDHEIYQVDPQEVSDTFVEIATAYDEPFANSSAVPSLVCARRARASGVDLLLAGDGGDELFAGNSRYTKDRIYQRYRKLPHFLRKGVVEPLALRLNQESRIGPVRKAAKYTRLGMMSIPIRALKGNIYAFRSAESVFCPDLAASLDLERPKRLLEDIFAEPDNATDLQRYLYLDWRITLADSDLRKIGRMCDLAGIRVRFPMLDDAMISFAETVPPEILCENGVLRNFYKEAFSSLLPQETINKPKHGFGLPFQEFLGQDDLLQSFAIDTLMQLKKRRLFNDLFLNSYVSEIKAGESGAFDGAWDLVVLEHWLASRSL